MSCSVTVVLLILVLTDVHHLWAGVIEQPALEFDCSRQEGENPCQNGGTCNDSTCFCRTSWKGFDCSLSVSDVDDQANCACTNEGICKTDGKCHCPATHYGDACDMETLQGFCEADQLMINVNVPYLSNTKVFVLGYEDLFHCSLPMATPESTYMSLIPDNWIGYVLQIPLAGDAICGKITITDESTDTKCIQVLVMYTNPIITISDTKVTFCCRGATVSVVASSVITGNNLDGLRTKFVQNEIPNSGIITPLQVDDYGHTIPTGAEKMIGDPLNIIFSLSENTDFTAIRVESCTATNGQTTISIVKNRCPLYSFVKDIHRDDAVSKKVVTMKLSVVRIASGATLKITCQVKICYDSVACSMPNCEQEDPRRKRDVIKSNNQTRLESITTEITVIDPFVFKTNSVFGDDAGINPIILITSLGVLAFLLLCLTVFIVEVFIRRRFKSRDKMLKRRS